MQDHHLPADLQRTLGMANLADVNPSLLQNVANQLPQGQHRGLDQQELTRALIRQQQQQQQQQHGVKVSPASTHNENFRNKTRTIGPINYPGVSKMVYVPRSCKLKWLWRASSTYTAICSGLAGTQLLVFLSAGWQGVDSKQAWSF